jgi:SAM-dependent methyltransferase
MEPREYEIMYLAEGSHWWYQGMFAITQRIMETHLCPAAGSRPRILDAGCGTGGGMLFLSRHGPVTGLDISSEAVRYCCKRGLKYVVRGSVLALPFFGEAFDLVTSFDILYFKEIDDRVALQEASRVLRPGGKMIVRVPAFDWLRGTHDIKVSTRHRYSLRELAAKMERSGFEIEFINYANTILFPVAVIKRILEKWLPSQRDSDITLPMGIFSSFCKFCLFIESRIIMKRRFPFGLSLVALGRKKLRRSL